ncbi:hypothetical protein EAF04_005364 [Stromatinia cepivora]|nr:hypothetical protein EAF04_005364 [Stromatinia cepivora]
MGVEVSTLVSRRLRHQTIDDILQDVNILEELVAAIPSLSSTSRANLQTFKINSTKTTRSKGSLQTALQTPKLRPLLEITAEHVRLSKNIQSEYPHWLKDWTTFLDVSTTSCIGGKELKDLLIEKYNNAIQLEKRRTSDRFRWRFFTLFFYDLRTLFTSSGYNANQALDKVVNTLVKDDATGNLKQDVYRNVKKWTSVGLRYHILAASLGSAGCLFLLPESISDNIWEDYLPIKGPSHDETVALLESADIKQKSESVHAGRLGTSIREGLLEPFKWHCSVSASIDQHTRSKRKRTFTDSENLSSLGPGLGEGPISSATSAPANYARDSTGNNQSAMDILSAAAVLEQSITESSNIIYPTVGELSADPSEWTIQSQQAFASQNMQRHDMFGLTSFDISPFPDDTYSADILSFPVAGGVESRCDFAALVSSNLPFFGDSIGVPSSFLRYQ